MKYQFDKKQLENLLKEAIWLYHEASKKARVSRSEARDTTIKDIFETLLAQQYLLAKYNRKTSSQLCEVI